MTKQSMPTFEQPEFLVAAVGAARAVAGVKLVRGRATGRRAVLLGRRVVLPEIDHGHLLAALVARLRRSLRPVVHAVRIVQQRRVVPAALRRVIGRGHACHTTITTKKKAEEEEEEEEEEERKEREEGEEEEEEREEEEEEEERENRKE